MTRPDDDDPELLEELRKLALVFDYARNTRRHELETLVRDRLAELGFRIVDTFSPPVARRRLGPALGSRHPREPRKSGRRAQSRRSGPNEPPRTIPQ